MAGCVSSQRMSVRALNRAAFSVGRIGFEVVLVYIHGWLCGQSADECVSTRLRVREHSPTVREQSSDEWVSTPLGSCWHCQQCA